MSSPRPPRLRVKPVLHGWAMATSAAKLSSSNLARCNDSLCCTRQVRMAAPTLASAAMQAMRHLRAGSGRVGHGAEGARVREDASKTESGHLPEPNTTRQEPDPCSKEGPGTTARVPPAQFPTRASKRGLPATHARVHEKGHRSLVRLTPGSSESCIPGSRWWRQDKGRRQGQRSRPDQIDSQARRG